MRWLNRIEKEIDQITINVSPVVLSRTLKITRLDRFLDKGLDKEEAMALDAKLNKREAEWDDRINCIECNNFKGLSPSFRCTNAIVAEISVLNINVSLGNSFLGLLQRCNGFQLLIAI